MASTSSMRQAIQASQHSMPRKAALPYVSRRAMTTTSAMSLPLEESPGIDLQIFDIFDAPSRLGESTKLLSRAASRATNSRTERSMSTIATTPQHVSPLPSPILFEGPARPAHLPHGTLRARRTHSHALSSPRLNSPESVAPLPAPVMFDGPSRLRPYARGRPSSDDLNTSSTTLLAVAATGAVVLAGYNALKEDTTRPPQGGQQ
ncbi:hypothetical protein BC835DRAFT_1303620 [Cytidiella melzeri]|nr:hypothetical protein BC835DRAFT_1303620 [Cytidiella melzeri]